MKGHAATIDVLNDLLSDELTAVNQYMVHAEMDSNWGYERLHEAVQKRAIDEMRHAERLIERILFLEGRPVVSKLNQISIGAEVEPQIRNDLAAETMAVEKYNQGIKRVVELGDNGTRELLESILGDEERHADWLEVQLDQIAQMGIKNYLTEQMD